ncbi:MAG: carboxypeptidase-like regulatory domain-containing protein, partial [Bacteroidota bacterium]
MLFIIAGNLFPAILFSQNTVIKGKITDVDSNEPVPFVNIGIKDQHKGTTSDMDGKFELPVTSGEYIILFSSIGYEKHSEKVSVKGGKPIVLNVSLKVTIHDLNTTVVSASKYEQKLEDATNSVDIIKPGMLETKNILTLDKAIESVPGVAIVDNEPQIRGGSGFSSGLGSRVMILIDEIPIMSPDAGRPVWSFLPVEDVEQIEVVKGASSVMYGSAALNGAINIRT